MGLHNLSVLILTANSLQFLDPQAFQDLTSLQRLVVVENNLVSLESLPIGHLTSLRELNLRSNRIDTLKLPKYFSHLIFLQHLNLQSNKITSISVGDLSALSRLNLTLVLSNNDIRWIQPDSFAGIYLQELSLRSCFENSTIMQAALQNLAGLHVKSLVLGEHRNIRRLTDFSKSLLDGLCHLSVQELTLICFQGYLDNTASLSACVNNISTVRLMHTYLSHMSAFPHNSRIRHLEFQNSGFEHVPLEVSSLKELRVLRIRKGTSLTEFDMKGFQGLLKLEMLDLSENRINAYMCWSCLVQEVPNLKLLNLSFNSLVTLSADYTNPPKLEYLDLQHTRLRGPGAIPVFLYLENLIYLDISYTNIHIEMECPFCGLSHLQVLKMPGSSFENNELVNSFTNVTKLQILDISSCKLQHVAFHSFAGLLDLRELNISHNKLMDLHLEAFVPLQALTTLDFQNNQLATMTVKDMETLSSGLKLDLSRNLFHCFCDYLTFLHWAKAHQELFLHAEKMVCHSPEHLKDVPLLSFDLSSCHISTMTLSLSVSISLAVALSCILVYKYYIHIYYMVLLHKGSRFPTEHDNIYDAFVIYSSEDQEWVTEQLQETLERGVPRFRLCLYYRDFLPGVSIITNIIKEGFQNSRKVIAVVSSHFLESRWCNFELEIAQSWQLLDSKASLILIVLEGADKAVLQRKLGLFRYLRRNTYLVWKDSDVKRHVLLRQLKVALLDGKTWTEEESKVMLRN